MNSSERVAAYFDNELNEAEKLQFEKELESNTELQREYNLQNEIIEGIRTARKAELKAMLNEVPIGGGLSGGSQVFQYLGAAVVTIFIGVGLYYFWPGSEEPELLSTSEPTETLTTPEEELELSQPVDETVEISEGSTEIADEESETMDNKGPVIEEKIPGTEQQDESTVSIADVKPVIPGNFDTEENSSADLPENNLIDRSRYSEGPVEVEITSSERKYDFHYQFMNGKLMLYGKFNDTYEILDFMQEDERSIYLYYQSKYYPLVMTQNEVKKLEEITDSSVISNLESRRTRR